MSEDSRIGAAVDVGSNSVHLLVVAIAGQQRRVIRDESELLGLGAVVDMEGRIPDDIAATAVELVRGYVETAREAGADWIGLLATEPLRRASNRTHVCDLVQQATGLRLHVLSHEEEAGLTVLGVLDGEPPSEPTLVLDIGGGSSELVLLEPGADPLIGVMPADGGFRGGRPAHGGGDPGPAHRGAPPPFRDAGRAPDPRHRGGWLGDQPHPTDCR
jgi:exopolyphosphatase/pppGpp-phosphohydrolase